MTKTAREIDSILKNGGYLVDVVFHKVGTNITIKPEVFGLEFKNNPDLETFFQQFIRRTQVSWLGKNNVHIRKAESIAKSVHNRKIKDSLDGKHYIPKTRLAGFKDFLRTKKEEYFKVRDELVDTYELSVRSFERKLENDFLNETVKDNKQRSTLIKAIMNKVPTKEAVYDSFKVEDTYMAFAMMYDEVDEEDKEAAVENANIRMKRIIGNTLSVVFDKTNTILNAIIEKRYTKRHSNMLQDIISEIDERNIFSHLDLENLKKEYESISDSSNLADYEYIVGRIYFLADEAGETDQLNLADSVFSLSQLEFLAKTFK